MTIYELLMDHSKKTVGLKQHQENENYYVIQSSLISGMVAALLMNSIDVIVIRKQAEMGETVMQTINKEGLKMLTKGLTAKMLQAGGYSVVFFTSMHHIGKFFDTNLSDDDDE
jgi:hypothetical protein